MGRAYPDIGGARAVTSLTPTGRRSRNGGIDLGSASGHDRHVPIIRIVKRQIGPSVYDAIAAELDIDRQHPLGLIMHGAAKTGDTVEIAQVWESVDYAHLYDEERLRPALEAAGAPLDAEIAVFELHHLVTP